MTIQNNYTRKPNMYTYGKVRTIETEKNLRKR